jgi:hypothetical protein
MGVLYINETDVSVSVKCRFWIHRGLEDYDFEPSVRELMDRAFCENNNACIRKQMGFAQRTFRIQNDTNFEPIRASFINRLCLTVNCHIPLISTLIQRNRLFR